MIDHDARADDYQTSIDRVGLALALGGATCGVLAAVLVALSNHPGITTMASALLIGTVFSALGIAAVGGPVWLAMHAAGWRGPGHAALAGAAIGFLLFLFGQSDMISAAESPLQGWLRTLGSSFVLAAIASVIALAMWRVAYRRGG